MQVEEQAPTFFLYLVVFATAKTPFLIALVHKWCKTTWLGTGNTDASSVIEGIFDVSIVMMRESEMGARSTGGG